MELFGLAFFIFFVWTSCTNRGERWLSDQTNFIPREKHKIDREQVALTSHQKTNAQKAKLAWNRKVTDEALENELEDMIYDISNYDKIWKEVSTAYAEMPWKKDAACICLSPEILFANYGRGFTKKERENIINNSKKEAMRIMMANRGKLTRSDAMYGIECTEGFSAPTVLRGQQWNKDKTSFVLWIQNKLKQFGIEEDLYITNGSIKSLVTEPQHGNGMLKFYPATLDINCQIPDEEMGKYLQWLKETRKADGTMTFICYETVNEKDGLGMKAVYDYEE